MPTRVAVLAAFGLAMAVVFGASAGADQSSPQQPRQIPGAFRSSITLVPIDVRVLDRRGRPITDLTKDDFTVFEDKVPHEIQQFVRVAMTANPDPVERGDAAASEPAVLAPPVRRTFLLVLGRGRLQTPSRGLDGLLKFVRRLLPQDRLAVLAYNRGTHRPSGRRLPAHERGHSERRPHHPGHRGLPGLPEPQCLHLGLRRTSFT